MGRIIHRPDCFRCSLSTAEKINAQRQEMLDRCAGNGWFLHAHHAAGMGDFCSPVFCREERE